MENDSGVVSDNLPLFSDIDEEVSTYNLSYDNDWETFWLSTILVSNIRSLNFYHHQGFIFLQIIYFLILK